MASRAFDRNFAFQMTLHAHRVAAFRRKPGGIYDRTRRACDLRASDMCGSRAMTPLAADAGIQECGLWIEVLGPQHRRTHAADVATQTTGEGRQVEGDLARVLVRRSHVPALLVAIPVDRGLEQKATLGEQVAQPATS